jgi:hypothetical protein
LLRNYAPAFPAAVLGVSITTNGVLLNERSTKTGGDFSHF